MLINQISQQGEDKEKPVVGGCPLGQGVRLVVTHEQPQHDVRASLKTPSYSPMISEERLWRERQVIAASARIWDGKENKSTNQANQVSQACAFCARLPSRNGTPWIPVVGRLIVPREGSFQRTR